MIEIIEDRWRLNPRSSRRTPCVVRGKNRDLLLLIYVKFDSGEFAWRDTWDDHRFYEFSSQALRTLESHGLISSRFDPDNKRKTLKLWKLSTRGLRVCMGLLP